MKRGTLTVLSVFAALALVAASAATKVSDFIEGLSVQVTGYKFDFGQVSSSNPRLLIRVDLLLTNQSNTTLTFNSLQGNLYYQGIKIARVGTPIQRKIEAYTANPYTLTVAATVTELTEAGLEIADLKQFTGAIQFKGNLFVNGIKVPLVKDIPLI